MGDITLLQIFLFNIQFTVALYFTVKTITYFKVLFIKKIKLQPPEHIVCFVFMGLSFWASTFIWYAIFNGTLKS